MTRQVRDRRKSLIRSLDDLNDDKLNGRPLVNNERTSGKVDITCYNDTPRTSRPGHRQRASLIFGPSLDQRLPYSSKSIDSGEMALGQQEQQPPKPNEQTTPAARVKRRRVSAFGVLTPSRDFNSCRTTEQQAQRQQLSHQQAGRSSQVNDNKRVVVDKYQLPSKTVSNVPSNRQQTVKPFRSMSSLRSPTPEASPPKNRCVSQARTYVQPLKGLHSSPSPPSGPRGNAKPAENRLTRSRSLRRDPCSGTKASPDTQDEYKEWYALLERIRTMNLS